MGDFIVETEARKERGKIWERNKNGEMFEWMTCLMNDERKPLHVFDWQFHWGGGEREREVKYELTFSKIKCISVNWFFKIEEDANVQMGKQRMNLTL